MTAKKKKKGIWKNGDPCTFYSGVAWFACQGICFWLIEHPAYRLSAVISKNIGYLIISRLLILLPVVIFCYTRCKKLRWWESTLAVFTFLLPMEVLLPWGERYSLLLYAALIPIFIVGSVYRIRKKSMPYLLMLLPFCFFMIFRSRYTYHLIDVEFFKYYLPSLILALTATGLGFWFMKYPVQQKGTATSPFWLAFIVGATCGILCMSVAQITTDNINYAFDRDPSEAVALTVTDMRTDHHRRTPTDYELLVELGGEHRWVRVPRDVYYRCQEGEPIALQLHRGALGMTYVQALE